MRSQSMNFRMRTWRRFWLCALLACASFPADAPASGYFGPRVYLGEGGRLADATPEFYWELEVKRLARDFKPPEKRVLAPPVKRDPPADDPGGRAEWVDAYALFTTAQDLAEYAEALRKGALQVTDSAEATRMHAAARKAIDATERNRGGRDHTEALPVEIPSEFADYHRGAHAYRDARFKEAIAAWQALLRRPPEERRYRSVWAAFMLGKTCAQTDEGSPEEAIAWFQKTRELAREGCADSLGLAADSYGWQAAEELALGRPRRAAELYLTDLAAGSKFAVDGLKSVVPHEPEDDWRAAAADPLLRKLTSMYQLAFSPWGEKAEQSMENSKRWVTLLQDLKIKDADGAEYLGWVAYQVGEYDLAGRWLRMAKGDSPAALWLQAKLLRRAGKPAEAAQAMLRAWKTLQNPALYARWDYPADRAAYGEEQVYDPVYFSVFTSEPGEQMTFSQNAGGDYGAFRLSRGEFIPALDAFRQAGLWIDAAYIAEEVLSTNELMKYVSGLPPEPPRLVRVQDEQTYEEVRFRSMRHLLGRRLMRDGRYAEAVKYMPPPYDEAARRYAQALREAENARRSREDRAHSYFKAGWLARYVGMELMGTEGEPDGYATRGDFPAEKLGEQRTARRYLEVKYDEKGGSSEAFRQMALQPTGAELKRLQKNRVTPAVRFHYRLIGAKLMMKGAALLPDNSDDLADVINRAGRIAADMDHDLADGYYQQLERRCAKTWLGKEATEQRWFVPRSGRWSLEEKAILDTLLAKRPPPPAE